MHRRQPPESGIEHRKLKGIYGSLDVIAGRAVVFPAVDILRAQGGGWPHFDFAAGFMRHRLYSWKAGCGVGRRHHRLGEEETNPLVFLRRCRPNASPPHAVQRSQTLRQSRLPTHSSPDSWICELLACGAGGTRVKRRAHTNGGDGPCSCRHRRKSRTLPPYGNWVA